MDYESESKLLSLLIELISPKKTLFAYYSKSKIVYQVISLLRSMDWDLQSKPESEFMSLITQIIIVFSTMDLDSQPKPLSEFISFVSREILSEHRSAGPMSIMFELDFQSDSHLRHTLELEPEPELVSLILQIFSFLLPLISLRDQKVVSLCPQASVILMTEERFHVDKEAFCLRSNKKWECFPLNWFIVKSTDEEDVTYFHCLNCNGENHKEYNTAPVVIKHALHPKHSLRLVLCEGTTRECYCCDAYLEQVFYYCRACDLAINFACAQKQPVLSVENPKWHEHTLTLFPRKSLLTCDVCALTHSRYPFYTCPPCDFVIHQSCISLPRVIRISRHLHRIAFTPSFDLGDWFCGVCRQKIDNNYGGYCCIKKDCLYGAHSKCATQSNVWDGEELEGKPEEIEEEIEPFMTISNGIIQHFLHQHHHLILDENTGRDYNENRQCQACVTPIYFGNFYSCMQCDFILHEECANLSRSIYHPIHQHKLTLVGGYDEILDFYKDRCSACCCLCKNGFFYSCSKEGCYFQLQLQCAMVSEPLVHESHLHPLYLTSKPEDKERGCSICENLQKFTFNCIECDFSLCFFCATLPQKVRYKHDKHTLTLSYGKETSIMTFWCEVCEKKINPKEQFYMCDEYCCVTIHIDCVLGSHYYMKPGSLWTFYGTKIVVVPNNHMSRPICSHCAKRCPDKIFFQCKKDIFCSMECVIGC